MVVVTDAVGKIMTEAEGKGSVDTATEMSGETVDMNIKVELTSVCWLAVGETWAVVTVGSAGGTGDGGGLVTVLVGEVDTETDDPSTGDDVITLRSTLVD